MNKHLFTLLLAIVASVGILSAEIINHVQIGDLYYNLDAENLTAEVTSQRLSESEGCNYSGLTSASIPSSVTYNSKTYSVTSIGDLAFTCSCSLTSVTIPNSVTRIVTRAFTQCYGLTSIVIENENTKYDSRNNCNAIVETATNTLVAGCMNTIIPNSVTSIGDSAFFCCTGLTSVTIPNSVTSIGSYAFCDCDSLTTVTVQAETPPSIGFGAFLDTYYCTIYVPCGSLNAYYQSSWAERLSIKYESLPYTISVNINDSDAGRVEYQHGALTICDNPVTIEAFSYYGYHFIQWSDGVTDNPRTIELTQDTIFTAEFAKNEYTITTASSNSEWGSTIGDTKALYLDEVEISATPNYGYHFVQWSDYSTSNPRTITITGNATYTATFAKNVYSVTKVTNSNQGFISGSSQAEYLDYVTLEAVPNYGYHFTRWSDGLRDNPRIVQLTQDTTFTAEFALDRTGTCGKDLALVWSYDPVAKVLTIGNAGAFTENMRFGAEAPDEMEELIIGHNVTSIGDRAFAGIETLKKVTIGESVKTIGEQAFYNCINLETIYNYRSTPTNAYSTAFDGVDKFECTLYVLPNSIDMYKNASVWRDFYYTYAIGASEKTVTSEELIVTPTVNTASVTWPSVANAATYELVIKDKSGNVVCTLIFNANGQLTQIAFGAPARDNATQAIGFSFTVTGLEGGTSYDLTITAKDSQGAALQTTTQSFTTMDSETAIGFVESSAVQDVKKLIRNGKLFILRDGKAYTVQGQEVR